MVIDVPVKTIVDAIGHDGSEIIAPQLPEPRCRRAYHIDELTVAALGFGYALVQLDAHPTMIRSDGSTYKVSPLLCYWLSGSPGLLGTVGPKQGHMCAWNGFQVYDPTVPMISEIKSYCVTTFWLCRKLA